MKVKYKDEEIELDTQEEGEKTLDYLTKVDLIKAESMDNTREISAKDLEFIMEKNHVEE